MCHHFVSDSHVQKLHERRFTGDGLEVDEYVFRWFSHCPASLEDLLQSLAKSRELPRWILNPSASLAIHTLCDGVFGDP